MHIAMWVPYDEGRLRRTLRFISRPQLKFARIVGGILALVGLALAALEPSNPIGYSIAILGLLYAVTIVPITVAWTMRMQSNAIKDGLHMTMDDEWLTVTYPLAEARFRWAGLDRVIESSEVWYVMFGRLQATTIPKDSMTDAQRAEFAAFVAGLRPAWK